MWFWLCTAGAMTLNEALDAAEQRSPVSRLAEDQVSEARTRAIEARGHLLPTATLSGAAVVQNEVAVNLGDQFPDMPAASLAIFDPTAFEPLVVQPGFQLQGAAELNQPLVAPRAWTAGGAARAGVGLAKAEGDSAKAELRQVVVEAWHRSAEARALVVDAEAGVAQAERLVARGEAMVAHGIATEDRVLPFRSALASANAALAASRAASSSAEGVLAQLTGVQGGADPVAVGDHADLPELADLLSAISRPDLEAARKRVDTASAARKVERTGLMPTVAAKAGLYAMTPAPDLADPVNWRVMVGASIPLFQGGSVAARVSGASARVSMAQSALRAQEERAAIQVRAAHAQLAAALVSLDARVEALRFAEQAVNAAEARMDGGAGSLLELQQAQASQLTARSELTRARAAAARARDLLQVAVHGQV